MDWYCVPLDRSSIKNFSHVIDIGPSIVFVYIDTALKLTIIKNDPAGCIERGIRLANRTHFEVIAIFISNVLVKDPSAIGRVLHLPGGAHWPIKVRLCVPCQFPLISCGAVVDHFLFRHRQTTVLCLVPCHGSLTAEITAATHRGNFCTLAALAALWTFFHLLVLESLQSFLKVTGNIDTFWFGQLKFMHDCALLQRSISFGSTPDHVDVESQDHEYQNETC